MCNEYICVLGDLSIESSPIRSGTQSKCTAIQRGDRRSSYPESINLDSFINEYCDVAQQGKLGRIRFKKELVISRYDKLNPMLQFTEPGIEVSYCSCAFRKHCEVARMDENVTIGYVGLPMEIMRVAKQHDARHSVGF